MTSFISFFILILSIFTFTSCEKIKPLLTKEQTHVVGGYSKPRSLTDQEELFFQKATANLQGVEYKPENVATQIVAGTNYRFLCKARSIDQNGKKGKRHYAAIVIHKPLNPEEQPRILSIDRESR